MPDLNFIIAMHGLLYGKSESEIQSVAEESGVNYELLLWRVNVLKNKADMIKREYDRFSAYAGSYVDDLKTVLRYDDAIGGGSGIINLDTVIEAVNRIKSKE